MKLFFISLMGTVLIGGIGSAVAQNALFPELSGVKGLTEAPVVQPADANDAAVAIDDTVLSPASVPVRAVTPQTPAEAALAATPGNRFGQKEDKKDSGKFRLLPDNLEIVTPPVRGFAYCLGELTLENQTGVDLKQMRLKLKFGGVSVPVTFSGVPNKGTQTQDIGSAGSSCQSFTGVPGITVEACQAGSWSPAECQAKIQYVPIQ